MLLRLCEPPTEQHRLVPLHPQHVTEPSYLLTLPLSHVLQQRHVPVSLGTLLRKPLNFLCQRVNICFHLAEAATGFFLPPLDTPALLSHAPVAIL